MRAVLHLVALVLAASAFAGETCGVEIGEFSLARSRVGKKVTADVLLKNAAGKDLANVRLVLVLFDGDKEVARSEAAANPSLLAGRSCRLSPVAEEAPQFTSYRLLLAYTDDAPREFAFVGADPTAAPVLDAPPPKEEEPPTDPSVAQGKSPSATIGLLGLGEVEGEWVGEGKHRRYTGDVYFVKLAFRDAEGKPVVQKGTVEVIVRQGKKVIAQVRRAVQEGHYKLDAKKLTAKTATPEVVCFHADENAVWVGLLRWTSNDKFAAQIDVAFLSAEGERWTWKALEDPWSEDAKGRDE